VDLGRGFPLVRKPFLPGSSGHLRRDCPYPTTATSRSASVDKMGVTRSSWHPPISELQATPRIFLNERLDRGRHESPRPRTLGTADEPLSTSATPRRCVDTRNGRRIYRWADCRRLAVSIWKRSINANSVRRWQDSLGFLVERYRKPQSIIELSPRFCSVISRSGPLPGLSLSSTSHSRSVRYLTDKDRFLTEAG
jgi:hypothetical protein